LFTEVYGGVIVKPTAAPTEEAQIDSTATVSGTKEGEEEGGEKKEKKKKKVGFGKQDSDGIVHVYKLKRGGNKIICYL